MIGSFCIALVLTSIQNAPASAMDVDDDAELGAEDEVEDEPEPHTPPVPRPSVPDIQADLPDLLQTAAWRQASTLAAGIAAPVGAVGFAMAGVLLALVGVTAGNAAFVAVWGITRTSRSWT